MTIGETSNEDLISTSVSLVIYYFDYNYLIIVIFILIAIIAVTPVLSTTPMRR